MNSFFRGIIQFAVRGQESLRASAVDVGALKNGLAATTGALANMKPALEGDALAIGGLAASLSQIGRVALANPIVGLAAVVVTAGVGLKRGLDAITNDVYRFNEDVITSFKASQARLQSLMPEIFGDAIQRATAEAQSLSAGGFGDQLKVLRDAAQTRAEFLAMERSSSEASAAAWAEAVKVVEIYDAALKGVVKTKGDDAGASAQSAQAMAEELARIREQKEELGKTTDELIALKQARKDALSGNLAGDTQEQSDRNAIEFAKLGLEIEQLKLRAAEERAGVERQIAEEASRRQTDEARGAAEAARQQEDGVASYTARIVAERNRLDRADAARQFEALPAEARRAALSSRISGIDQQIAPLVGPSRTSYDALRQLNELRQQRADLQRMLADVPAAAAGRRNVQEGYVGFEAAYEARVAATNRRRVIRMSMSQDSAFGNLGGLSGVQESFFAKNRAALDEKRERTRAAAQAGLQVSERTGQRQEMELGGRALQLLEKMTHALGDET